MAYKQKGCTPVTAKIKRTTKGGMSQQPLLNMGAPVKMKMHSPAKQGGENNKRNRGAVSTSPSAPSTKNTKSEIERLKKEIGHMTSAMESYQKKGGEKNASDARYLKKTQDKLASLQSLPINGAKGVDSLQNKNKKQIDLAARKAGKAGRAADDLARKNKTGQYAPKKDTPKQTAPKKNKVTGKIGSELRRKQYDKLGWAHDDTIAKKPKAKKVVSKELSNKTGKVADVVKESKIITPNNNALDKKTARKVARKTKSAEKKESRSARVRQKGIEALNSGDKQKALRLKRREERINKRGLGKEDKHQRL